jgi:5'-3' exonuclease
MARGSALLVDGNNLAMRSIYAARYSHMSAEGVNTGPMKIFIDSLAKIVQDEQPLWMGIAWDGTSKMRTELISGYKANRHAPPSDISDLSHDSFKLIITLLMHLGIHQVRFPQHEADDVIAAWWRWFTPDQGDKITIASADKDFLQLVGPNPQGVPTELLRLSSGDAVTDRWDEARVVEELGYRPDQWPLVASLTGDKVDNIIGIPGIGPKKAVKLLESHGWNPIAAAQAAFPEHEMQIRDNLIAVDLRSEGNTIDTLALPSFPRKPVLSSDFESFLDHYKMISLKGKVTVGTLWDPHSSNPPGRPFQLPIPGA